MRDEEVGKGALSCGPIPFADSGEGVVSRLSVFSLVGEEEEEEEEEGAGSR